MLLFFRQVDMHTVVAIFCSSLPNGDIVEGAVESWRDYDDGDQLQITVDGVTYLLHAANVALMTEEKS